MFAASKTDSVSGAVADAQFNYVTMLLHGDGTNGAQNNTFVDSSTNTFTITRNGNTTQGSFSPYGSNWSNFFDGSGDYLATSSTQIIPASTTYTVEAWVYLTGDYSDYREIVTQGSSGNANRWLMVVNITDGILIIQTGASGITTSFTVPRNTWTHLAFVNNSGSYTVYANGTSVGSGTNTVTPQNTYVTVGAFQSGAEYFQGYISNVRITNTAVYTSAFTPSTTPLTAISGTSFLTCQSNRFIDNSANTYAITAYGNSSVQRFNPFGASTAYSTSVIGGSGYFDGTGDYLSTANSSAFAFGTGNFTLEFWYRGTSTTGGFGLLTGGSSGYWQLNLFSGTMYWQDAAGSSNLLNVSASPILNNAWNHVAVVRNSTTTTIYFNGVSVTSATDTTNYSGTGGNFQLGFDSNNNYIAGYISDYRIVKGTAVYTANFTPPTAPLTAVTNTQLLLNTINGAIFDNAMMNDLETVGDAQISTSVVKYGTGSLAFDGTGDALYSTSQATTFGTGDFTLEFWVYFNAVNNSTVKFIYDMRNSGATSASFLAQEASNSWTYWNGAGTSISSGFTSSTFTSSTWTHVAISRSSGTTRFFAGGTLTNSVADTSNYANSTLTFGARYSISDALNAYIDDLRITKGYARYTATFTPPTSALSDTGPY